jgi:hypothetical protein
VHGPSFVRGRKLAAMAPSRARVLRPQADLPASTVGRPRRADRLRRAAQPRAETTGDLHDRVPGPTGGRVERRRCGQNAEWRDARRNGLGNRTRATAPRRDPTAVADVEKPAAATASSFGTPSPLSVIHPAPAGRRSTWERITGRGPWWQEWTVRSAPCTRCVGPRPRRCGGIDPCGWSPPTPGRPAPEWGHLVRHGGRRDDGAPDRLGRHGSRRT